MSAEQASDQASGRLSPAEQAHRALAVFRRNLMVVIVLVSLAPLLGIAAILVSSYGDLYSDKVAAHLKELVGRHKQTVNEFLEKSVQVVGYVADANTPEQLTSEAFLEDRLRRFQQHFTSFIVDWGVVDENGVQLAYAGPFHLRRAEYATAEWFREAKRRETWVSDVFSGIRGTPHFIVTARVNGQKPLILRATVDFAAFNQLVSALKVGKTGTAFIVNRAGEFQTGNKPEVDLGGILPRILAHDFSDDDPLVLEHAGADGREAIYVATTLKDGDWIMVLRQEKADALDRLMTTRGIAVGILVLGSMAIVAAAFFVTRRMAVRISTAEHDQEVMQKQVVESGKLAAIGELAAGIAHEINNPVAIMVEEAGWIEDLLTEEEFKALSGSANMDDIHNALKEITIQGRRCREITHKLLSFARKTDSRVEQVNLNELIEEVAALAMQKARYAKVTLGFDLAPDLPTACISPSEMQQVMLNLINNAIDAKDKDEGRITVTTRSDGNFIAIDVTDNGQGIAPANLERIFEPFFTTKPVGKGTGLGLSICYGIIHKMGGQITVESEVGAGTTFHLRIPAEKPCA